MLFSKFFIFLVTKLLIKKLILTDKVIMQINFSSRYNEITFLQKRKLFEMIYSISESFSKFISSEKINKILHFVQQTFITKFSFLLFHYILNIAAI